MTNWVYLSGRNIFWESINKTQATDFDRNLGNLEVLLRMIEKTNIFSKLNFQTISLNVKTELSVSLKLC